MNSATLRAAAFGMMALAMGEAGVGAQEYFPPVDRFAKVKEVALHDALVRLEAVREKDFARAEVRQDMRLVLRNVADGTLPVEGMMPRIGRLIEAATAMGDAEAVPFLVVLAGHENEDIRRTVASAQRLAKEHAPEVLLALVAAAEARLPKDLADKQAARERFFEFTSRITTYCAFTPFENRGPAREAVERFLSRYEGDLVRDFYEFRLREKLAKDFPLRVTKTPLELRVDTAQWPSVSVVVRNPTADKVRIWEPGTSWGWREFSFTLMLASGEKLTMQPGKGRSFKRNGPFFDEIAAGSEKSYGFNLSDGWWMISEKLEALEKDAAFTVQLSIEETDDAFEKRIHVGKCESKAVTLKKGTVLSGIRTWLER
jgi:hypothetical protein